MQLNYSLNIHFLKLMFLSIFLLAGYSNSSFGEEDTDCPQRVAVVDKSELSKQAAKIIQKIYTVLGCNTEFVYLPGRRGLILFNHHKIDGELFRLERAESLYEVDFVKSETPLFHTSFSLWAHPDKNLRQEEPIGYLLGIVWQEQYNPGNRKKSFNSPQKMYHAYNLNILGGFLSTGHDIEATIKRGVFPTPPYEELKIASPPLYHYLSKDYAPFMKRFSNYLVTHKPFTNFKGMSE